jgi:DNA polymerase-1
LGEGKAGRLVAKVLKFRIIYGGTGYSFAKDPDFTGVSSSVKFWDGIIEKYYAKYKGLKKWHDQLLAMAKRDGYITIPSGRYYEFKPELKYNNWQWPLTTIKNYPVQGLGADLVMLARIEAYRLIQESRLEALMVGTIHDSIVVDTPEKNCYTICMLLKQAVEAVPRLCLETFNYPFSLPLTCELQVGKNKRDMREYVI